MQNLIVRITQENSSLLENPQIGCFILADNLSSAQMENYISQAKQYDKLILLEGSQAVEGYIKYKADGLIINTTGQEKPQKMIREVQKKCPRAILGVVSRNRRHEAMLVSECEPDFVIFKVWREGLAANAELIEWYSELFLLQCAVQVEEDVDFASLSADLVILSDVQYAELARRKKV